jgi:enoyl-CoA hydratase
MTIIRESAPAEGVALLRLARPDVLNAMSLEMRRELAEQLEVIAAEPEIRATVITGDERAFAAGADVALLAERGTSDMHRLGLSALWARIFAHPKPLLAAVNGYAFGAGFELALLCDIIVAGPGTRFALPEIKLGIMPGAGGTQRLVRLAGRHRAMGLLLSGEPIDGETAERWGIVTELAARDADVLSSAIERARKIARMPPLAAELIKSAVVAGADLPLDAALMLEQRNMQVLFDTPEQKQRMKAFLEKRRERAAADA